MTTYIVTRSLAAIAAVAFIAILKWATGTSWQTAILAYLVMWTIAYDGRVITKAAADFERTFQPEIRP